MTFHSRFRQRLLVPALLGSLAFASPALALDAEDFAATLSAAFGTLGGEISYELATAEGDDITLGAARLSTPGQPDFDLGDLTFEDVIENGDGSYTVTRLGLADFSGKQEETEISVSGLELNGIRIPGVQDDTRQDQMISYERASSGPVSVEVNGQEIFSLAAFEGRVKPRRDGAGFDIKASADDVVIALDKIATGAPKSRKMFSELGHDKLRGDMDLNMGWDLETGRFHVREYSFTVADAGRVSMSFDISGYTPNLIKAIGEARATAIPAPGAQTMAPAMGFAMTGPAGQVTFRSGSIRFDDASATKKALAYAGGKQGMTGEQMAQIIQGLMPLAVWRLGMPELQDQIANAARTYLGNPQNITVSANPAAPVPVPLIISTRINDPWKLARLLNIQVTANEPVLLCCRE